MDAFCVKTGEKLTFAKIAEILGVSENSLNSISSWLGDQLNLATTDGLGTAQGAGFLDAVRLVEDPPSTGRLREDEP